MDIQQMVDARIRKLHGQTGGIAASSPAASFKDLLRAGSQDEIVRFGEMVDESLGEISSRVLEISEQVSNDYSRLENDLLKSRLDLLRSAEMVLDMALTLKKQARNLLESSNDDDLSEPANDAMIQEVKRPPTRVGRASLYNDGVADLFRRT